MRWRITDLGQWLWEEFQISVSPQRLSHVLREMGLRKFSARPKHHAQAEGAIAAFNKTSPPRWQVSRGTKGSGPRLSRFGSPMRPG